MLERLRRQSRALRREMSALALAYHDPRTPWAARLTAALVVAYALSPIDLIPDFIPVLGYLDDLIVLPLGIALAIRLIPPQVMADCRARADERVAEGGFAGRAGALIVIALWTAGLLFIVALLRG